MSTLVRSAVCLSVVAGCRLQVATTLSCMVVLACYHPVNCLRITSNFVHRGDLAAETYRCRELNALGGGRVAKKKKAR